MFAKPCPELLHLLCLTLMQVLNAGKLGKQVSIHDWLSIYVMLGVWPP